MSVAFIPPARLERLVPSRRISDMPQLPAILARIALEDETVRYWDGIARRTTDGQDAPVNEHEDAACRLSASAADRAEALRKQARDIIKELTGADWTDIVGANL